MKSETQSFYEAAVTGAVLRIVQSLDSALELEALARGAGLSAFHFHRIFRGMLGETPLEMHRRLRLERAARDLTEGDLSVTTIAFAAGYETHEAFTRAFQRAYAASPSYFRKGDFQGGERGPRKRVPTSRTELAARSGVHFTGIAGAVRVHVIRGDIAMNVTFETMSELRVACVAHLGPYNRINEAFAKLGAIAAPAGLLTPGALMIGVYYDDPETTAANELRSDAGISVAVGAVLPSGVVEKRLAGGRYAKTSHEGPYERLGDTWARLMGEWLPRSGVRVGEGPPYEVYRNTPEDTAPENLRTELYLPIL